MTKRIIEVLSTLICNIIISYFLGITASCTFIAGWIIATIFTLKSKKDNDNELDQR